MQISFQVIDGVDKGRKFLAMETPVTIGREEGNAVRLNDDRVSRFHAKVQEDHGHVVLTDLDSTNGTRVNGETVQLRLLRPGDRVNIGRSTLIFGTMREIAESARRTADETERTDGNDDRDSAEDVEINLDESEPASDFNFDDDEAFDVLERTPPALPERLTPAQAAQLSELVDFLHRALANATEPIHIPAKAREARLPLAYWHRVQAVLTLLADYSRQVSEPDGHARSESS